ncbi:PDC sensor domain-containing protein, partial [Peribacillus sp. SIMBA_075]
LVRYVSPASIGTAGKYITTETAKAALAVKKPYISKPYLTVNTKRLIVLISEPIFDKDGIYRGVIAGTIYLHENNILNTIFG